MSRTDVLVVMGSQSDWPTMKHCCMLLDELGVSYEAKIVSAHRTPDRLFKVAKSAEEKGFAMIIAGAGGAAHLPGMTAALTTLPVLGVPIESKVLKGLDSLYSIVQMPAGVPVATFAIGEPGAKNAAIHAAKTLAVFHPKIRKNVEAFCQKQTDSVAMEPKDEEEKK